MRLPAWDAAHDEVLGHLALAHGDPDGAARGRFAQASARFRDAGQPFDAQRCSQLAGEADGPAATAAAAVEGR